MTRKIKILVPVDFSPNAANALKYAIGFAEKHKTKITILHIINGNSTLHILPVDDKINPFDEERNRMKMMLERWSAKILKEKKYEVNYICVFGDIQDIILDQMKKIKPHITIMGNKGTGKSIGNFGSNTTAVLEKAEFPILAIPEKVKWHIPRKVTVATDYNLSDWQVIKQIALIFSPMKTTINLLHIADFTLHSEIESADMKKTVINAFKKTNYDKITGEVVYDSNIEDGIRKYILKNKSDILIITKIKKNPIEKLIQKNISDHALLFSRIPLFIFLSVRTNKSV